MLKTRTWIIIILIFFVCSGCALIMLTRLDTGTIAIIESPNQTYNIDLNSASNQEIVIHSEYGTNTVIIKDGKIRMIDADCPDRICVNTGWTNSPALPIVCLPHKVTVTIKKIKNDDIDAVVQ